jgi:hypothetical protein
MDHRLKKYIKLKEQLAFIGTYLRYKIWKPL